MLELIFGLVCLAVILLFAPRAFMGTKELIVLARREKMKRHLDWVHPQRPRRRKSRQNMRN